MQTTGIFVQAKIVNTAGLGAHLQQDVDLAMLVLGAPFDVKVACIPCKSVQLRQLILPDGHLPKLAALCHH